MKKIKAVLCIIMTFALLLSFSACSGKETSSDPDRFRENLRSEISKLERFDTEDVTKKEELITINIYHNNTYISSYNSWVDSGRLTYAWVSVIDDQHEEECLKILSAVAKAYDRSLSKKEANDISKGLLDLMSTGGDDKIQKNGVQYSYLDWKSAGMNLNSDSAILFNIDYVPTKD